MDSTPNSTPLKLLIVKYMLSTILGYLRPAHKVKTTFIVVRCQLLFFHFHCVETYIDGVNAMVNRIAAVSACKTVVLNCYQHTPIRKCFALSYFVQCFFFFFSQFHDALRWSFRKYCNTQTQSFLNLNWKVIGPNRSIWVELSSAFIS